MSTYPFRRSSFPRQSEPIYEFVLSPGGLVRKEHVHYVSVRSDGRRGSFYRILVGHGIVHEYESELDCCKHGKVFSLCGDMDRARRIMSRHYAAEAAKASARLNRCNDVVRRLAIGGAKGPD